MNFIDQWQADRKLQKTIGGLDLSAGMTDAPGLTAFDGDDPRLAEYLSGLRRVQTTIKEVAGSPEQVFLGDINLGRQSNLLVLFRQENEDRKIPPRRSFGVMLPAVDTVDTGIAVRHLTHLAAANLGIAPEDQKPLADKAIDTLKRNNGAISEIGITSKWRFGVWVNDRNKTVTPRLMPVEQKEYSQAWVDRQTKLVEQSIRPEALYQAVMAAAESDFCVKEAKVAEVNDIDIGGLPGAIKLTEEQGYEEFSQGVYRHLDSKPKDANALLRINTSWPDMQQIRFSAVPSLALKEKIRDEFARKFKPTAKEVIKQRIQKIPTVRKLIDLSPASLVDQTLESLGQRLEYCDIKQEENWLSSLAARALIDELRHFPEARPIAERLIVLQELAGDQSTLTHSPDAKIDFSLNETGMKFLLPKEWFTKPTR